MSRTPGRAKNRAEPASFSIPEGTELVEFRLARAEDKLERSQRLRRDFLSFLIKDLLSYLIAFSIILAAAVYSFTVLWRRDVSHDDRQWAMSVLASLLTALVGYAFGKSMK